MKRSAGGCAAGWRRSQTIVLAALIVEGLFSAMGLIPETRPTRDEVFDSIELDYKLFLNLLATAVFVLLFPLTRRQRARHPHGGLARA